MFGNVVDIVFVGLIVGRSIFIIGVGLFGFFGIVVVKVSGVYLVIVSELSEFRRKFVKKVGVDYVVNFFEEDLVKFVMDIIDGVGVEVFFEFSGVFKVFE